jgi:hypothetical protein
VPFVLSSGMSCSAEPKVPKRLTILDFVTRLCPPFTLFGSVRGGGIPKVAV